MPPSRVVAVRGVASALLLVLGLDVLVLLVTGSASVLTPGRPVGGAGFALRAVVFGLFLVLRVWVLAAAATRPRARRLLLILLLLPTLVQFQVAGGRLGGDGLMYYVYVRSLLKDGDLDFTNEYTQYGLIDRVDIRVPTRTGLRRSIFSIGPAVVSVPFFLLGEGLGRVQRLSGGDPDLSGYGPVHRNAVALGGLLYGFAAVLLIHGLLRRHFREGTALGAALLAWGATFLPWYMVQQPTTSHPASAFCAALAVWLWDRDRETRGPRGFLILGLVLGLAMCVRWQNGVLLALPAIELASRLRGGPIRRLLVPGTLLVAGVCVTAFPQMLAWKTLYGEWLLRHPPHGADFVRLDHPFVLETLFSMRHGLFSWTPVFWAGYLGFLPLLRRRPQLAVPLLVPLVLMTYVNFCSGDWWAGGSYSNRRFDSLLPILALGFAAAIDVARRFLAARPAAALAVIALPVSLWNATLMEQVRRGMVPRDDTVLFPVLVGGGARVLAEAVGSPPTWPASWLFAWRHHTAPSRYDGLVGRYLFYRQNNRGGRILMASPDDEAMLGEGWGRVESRDGEEGRRVRGRARVFAPLDLPEDLEVHLRVNREPGQVPVLRILVNGREAGRIAPAPGWSEHRLRATAAFWREGINDVVLEGGDGEVLVSAFQFVRVGIPSPAPRGRT